jgi:hypothetical protein
MICLGCSILANGYLLLREREAEAPSVDEFVGKMIRASLRFPPSEISRSVSEIKESSLEDVFSSFGRHNWEAMSKKEKLELTMVALFYCDMQGGDMVSLKELLGGDESAYLISTLSDREINILAGWNDSRYASFRRQLYFLLGARLGGQGAKSDKNGGF